MSVLLREKFYGCICGANIGSAMGAPVRGWHYKKIEETYGTLDKLIPYENYGNGWVRDAGTTEDGMERQKYMVTAIIEKGGRITADDLRKIWARDAHPLAAGNISEPFEGLLFSVAKAGVPGREICRHFDYANLATFPAACHPLGLINAGDIEGAMKDATEVGMIYNYSNSKALNWAKVVTVGIAAAMIPGATVDSVLATILDELDLRKQIGPKDTVHRDYAGMHVTDELNRALEATKNSTNHSDISAALEKYYSGVGMPYSMSAANEIITKAICVFRLCGGDVKKSVITAANLGRGADYTAAVAAGLSGALSGAGTIPAEWIKSVDAATNVNRFTNNKRTLRQSADGLFAAFENKHQSNRRYIAEMNIE